MSAAPPKPDEARPTPPRPQDNAGDAAAFIADVTAPPYTPLAPRTSFVKTWRVRNTGRTAWTAGYQLAFVEGDSMDGPPQAAVEEDIPPGSEAEVSVRLTAPAEEGAHMGLWQMRSARGEFFGARLPVIVAVLPGTAAGEARPGQAAPTVGRKAARPPVGSPLRDEGDEGRAGPGQLRNGAFDQGVYSRAGLLIPKHWDVWHADEATPLLPRQDQPFARPSALVLRLDEAPLPDRDAFAYGDSCWKVWTAWRPAWVVLRQRLTGLTPNARYRFSAPVHPDLALHTAGGEKHYADDPLAGEHRLTVSFGGQTLATVWKDGREVPFGATTLLTLDFSPTTAQATVAVEFRARWGMEHTGWFVEGARLELLPEDAPPPPAAPARRAPRALPHVRRAAPPPAGQPKPARPPAPKSAPGCADGLQSKTSEVMQPSEVPGESADLTPVPIRNRTFDLSLDGWQTWANVKEGECRYQMPRFEVHASPALPERVLAGRTALRIAAAPGTSFEAGVLQTVSGLAPGTLLRFNAHGLAWAEGGRLGDSEAGETFGLRIGLDPAGGTDPHSASVVWSEAGDPWGRYEQFQVEAVAAGEAVTLFLAGRPARCLQHTSVYWDNAALYMAGAQGVAKSAAEADAPEAGPVEGQAEDETAAAAPDDEAPAEDEGLPEDAGENLLRNPHFAEGFYYAAPEAAAPVDWELWCAGEDEERLERQTAPFARPEAAVWRRQEATPAEQDKYFRAGAHCWRVRSEWKPVWARLQQRVSGLTPGRGYRFVVSFVSEPWAVLDGEKSQYAVEPAAAEQRLVVESGEAAVETGWLGGDDVPAGTSKTLLLDFQAEAEAATVALELRGRWGLARNQWVVDGAWLFSHSTAPGVLRQ